MHTIFEKDILAGMLDRIDRLQPANTRQWGKMDAAQMLAHCCAALEMANGTNIPRRVPLGWILGPFIKPSFLGEKPFPHNSPTDKSFIISDMRDFAREKARLVQLVKAFAEKGEAGCTTHPHAFFGPLTPHEWGVTTFKHLDHHLRQFSV